MQIIHAILVTPTAHNVTAELQTIAKYANKELFIKIRLNQVHVGHVMLSVLRVLIMLYFAKLVIFLIIITTTSVTLIAEMKAM